MNNLELLKWQMDMGADEALESSPVNNFHKTKPAASIEPEINLEDSMPKHTNSPSVSPPVSVNNTINIMNPRDAIKHARELADRCNTLEELRDAIKNFDGCSIKKTATNTVFSDGNPQAKIMFIGEAPGAQEDIEGIPFCGQSGKLLDTMLKWIGLTRKENFYISNTIFWRPPGNRKPTPEETDICRPFVEKHIALINPKILVLVGSTATTSLLNNKTGITKLRGNYFEYSNVYLKSPIPVGVIFHPSYLLRSPGQKRFAWHDLLDLKHKFGL